MLNKIYSQDVWKGNNMYWLLFILWGLNAIIWIINDAIDPDWTRKLCATVSAVNSVVNLLMAISC